jgi:imidazolonepropionase-like amidohydrolase
MEEEIGKIRKGYFADFIVVRGKPHEDVSCLTPENILTVVKDGQPFGRNQWMIATATSGQHIRLQ